MNGGMPPQGLFGESMHPGKGLLLHLGNSRKEVGQDLAGRANAPIVVAALRHDEDRVLRAEHLVQVLHMRFAASAADRSLRHRIRRAVKASKRQPVDLLQQKRRRALNKPLLQLFVRESGGVSRPVFETGGPLVVARRFSLIAAASSGAKPVGPRGSTAIRHLPLSFARTKMRREIKY
jgi:hypothetical protein